MIDWRTMKSIRRAEVAALSFGVLQRIGSRFAVFGLTVLPLRFIRPLMKSWFVTCLRLQANFVECYFIHWHCLIML